MWESFFKSNKSKVSKVGKGAATILALPLLKLYKKSVVRFVKSEAAAMYRKSVLTSRKVFVGIVALILGLGLLISGFVLLHIGFYFYISLVLGKTKLAVLLLCILGAIYFLVPMIVLGIAVTERIWLKYSKCDEYFK